MAYEWRIRDWDSDVCSSDLSVMDGKTVQHVMRERVAAVPAADGAAGQAQFREGHYSSGIEKIHMAQAVAGRARAHRVVEAEQPGFQLGQAAVADRTSVVAGECVFLTRVQIGRAHV